jgi:hypothetical protein
MRIMAASTANARDEARSGAAKSLALTCTPCDRSPDALTAIFDAPDLNYRSWVNEWIFTEYLRELPVDRKASERNSRLAGVPRTHGGQKAAGPGSSTVAWIAVWPFCHNRLAPQWHGQRLPDQ